VPFGRIENFNMNPPGTTREIRAKTKYKVFLLCVAGLGGLLYGVDVGIIAGALPYLEATSGFNAGQLSFVVAAVLLGSVISTLFAGALADWLGRKVIMFLSGLCFVLSIPMIALSHSYDSLILGRLLQGVSAGLIGVVVPLYLAECVSASDRGKGTGIFQWLLTLGLVASALVGLYFSNRIDEVASLGDAAKLFAFKDAAWRNIFWVSLPPGLLFVIGSALVEESPRWLFRQGKRDAARRSLLRSLSERQTEVELEEMDQMARDETAKQSATGEKIKESLLRRKYVIPFVLACIILACNQATGANSIIAYNATILIQAGLTDKHAHLGYVILTLVNFVMTMGAVLLVDRKGRKFLLSLGTLGIAAALICVGLLFQGTEKSRIDCRDVFQKMVSPDQNLTFTFDQKAAAALLGDKSVPSSLIVIYSYGPFRGATAVARSNDELAKPIEINRAQSVPHNKIVAFFSDPFADLDQAKTAPLKIENALVTPLPTAQNGWLVAICLFAFMGFYAVGPGVCVWLALSELMPTRIRSNGMSIALLINQVVSTSIAAIFLPTVGKYGYSTMFFAFAACSFFYFIVARFFLPETKGKTLEEIEMHFEGRTKASA
jgi:SP family myo-inositol transporter-like MFS transporter 13